MEQNVRPFGLRDKAGYMFGDFGNDFTFILSSMFLLKFYTDVMGVPAGVVGIMMMAARVVDAVTDVAMGQIVDRTKPTERGKFVIWIRRMCGPVAVASFLMYASWFAHMPLGFKIFWMFLRIFCGGVCVIPGSIVRMVRWHRQFPEIHRTVHSCQTGEQSVRRWREP